MSTPPCTHEEITRLRVMGLRREAREKLQEYQKWLLLERHHDTDLADKVATAKKTLTG